MYIPVKPSTKGTAQLESFSFLCSVIILCDLILGFNKRLPSFDDE